MTHVRRAIWWCGSRRRFLVLAAVLVLAALLPLGVRAAGSSPQPPARQGAGQKGSDFHPDTRLMLTQKQWEQDQRGPTMDDMFPPNGLAMRVPILAWWLVLEMLGLIAFPFCFLLLAGLADRGFVIAKTMGLLLVSYLAWITASLGIPTFDRGFLWLSVFVLAAASACLAFALRRHMVLFFRERWRGVLAAELVFLAGFAIFLALRMWYPDLHHQFSPVSPTNLGDGRMGEKQMELAFLNAVVRSRVFPPFDPFFAHGYINYYYYGFVLVGALCKLSQIIPSTGFNLAIATFFGMLAGNTFSVVYALVRRITPGVVAAVLLGLIGNLNAAWQLLQGLMQVATIHLSFPLVGGLIDVLSGFQQVLVAHQSLPPIDFWGPTRIIPPPGIPISEFPYFTYLFADLHPHLIAFPMTVAAIGLAVSLLLTPAMTPRLVVATLLLGGLLLGAIAVTNPWDFPTYLVVVGLGALVRVYGMTRRVSWSLILRPALWAGGTGLLSFLLYVPFQRSYQTVFTTGIGLVRDIKPESLQGLCTNNPNPCGTVIHDALVTPLTIYLEHFGLFVFIILSYLILLLGLDAAGFRRGKRWVTRAHFALYYRDRRTRLLHASRIAGRMIRRREGPVLDRSLLVGLVILVGGLFLLHYVLLAFLVAVMGLAGLLTLRLGREMSVQQLFLVGLVVLPLLLSALTQIVYVKDFLDGGAWFRMNTIFKFYNQAWVLYAIASATALYYFVARLSPAQAVSPIEAKEISIPHAEPVLVASGAGSIPVPPPIIDGADELPPADETYTGSNSLSAGWQRLTRFVGDHSLWSAALGLLLVGSLVYTYGGTISRQTYRTAWLPENAVPFTLDGTAFMKVAYPGDYAGISWLNAHVRGAPVIAEAYDPVHSYNWYSRVAVFTGLPDIMNGIHEAEQRWGDEIDPSGLCSATSDPTGCLQHTHSRAEDVKMLYDSPAVSDAWQVIRQYGVRYVYVGFCERQAYSHRGLAKFNGMVGHGLRVVFRGPGTTIYQVTRSA